MTAPRTQEGKRMACEGCGHDLAHLPGECPENAVPCECPWDGTADHDQDRRDGEALRLLREALPEGWGRPYVYLGRSQVSLSVDGPYREEQCDHGYYHGEHNRQKAHGEGPTIAEAADACRARLPR